MNEFKNLGITATAQKFLGDKIKMDRVINRKIIVHHFEVRNSQFEKGHGQYLMMQVTVDGTKRLLGTGSGVLIDMISRVPENAFPFTTTIVKDEGGRLEFT